MTSPPGYHHGYPAPGSQAGAADTTEVYSSSYTSAQYSYEHAQHVAPPPAVTPRDSSAQAQLKRSKSAQFDYESQAYTAPPHPADPYHYPPRVYPPGYSHSFHPPHPASFYSQPGAAPGYPPYDSRAYQPPPACSTCSALIAQYGFVPPEHLHDHALRSAHGQEPHVMRTLTPRDAPHVYHDYNVNSSASQPHHPSGLSSQPHHAGGLTSQPRGESAFRQHLRTHEHFTPSTQHDATEHVPAQTPPTLTSAQLERQSSSSNGVLKRQKRLSSSSDKGPTSGDAHDNDLDIDDFSAFSGSKHQHNDSDATRPQPPPHADASHVTHSSAAALSSTLPASLQAASADSSATADDALSSSLPAVLSNSAKTQELLARLEQANAEPGGAGCSDTANTYSQTAAAAAAGLAENNNSIDENIPERDTNALIHSSTDSGRQYQSDGGPASSLPPAGDKQHSLGEYLCSTATHAVNNV